MRLVLPLALGRRACEQKPLAAAAYPEMIFSSRIERRRFRSLGQEESCDADTLRPNRYRDLGGLPPARKYIPLGSGLSLTPAAYGPTSTVVDMGDFNRILFLDANARRLTAEAGVTLGRLYDVLTPQGVGIPVQPGHPSITLGGCIAANVHGKAPYRDQTFADIVERINLFHPAFGTMSLGRNENRELFELTCGGFGLTGIIVSATIRIDPLPGNDVALEFLPVRDLAQACALFLDLRTKCDLLYSWHDFASGDAKFGPGFVVAGTIVAGGDATRGPSFPPLDPSRRYPLSLFNACTIKGINWIYNALHRRKHTEVQTLFEAQFPFAARPYYFYAFGPRGLIEHQALIPLDAVDGYARDLRAAVIRSQAPVYLATAKLFAGDRRLLRFAGSGISVALHLANTEESAKLLDHIDHINIEYGAITNLIKDSRVPREVVHRQYAEFEMFKEQLRRHDPDRWFVSALSERLGL